MVVPLFNALFGAAQKFMRYLILLEKYITIIK